MRKMNAYTKILHYLGKLGPLTAEELKFYTGMKGVQIRIAEFNRAFTNIEIGAMLTRPQKYFIKFPTNIKIDSYTIYPNKDLGDYSLNTKKKSMMAKKGDK
jgi:hypothetical protein